MKIKIVLTKEYDIKDETSIQNASLAALAKFQKDLALASIDFTNVDESEIEIYSEVQKTTKE